MMTYAQAMAFVTGFSRSGEPVRDLSRIRGLMEKLGDPQDSLRFVHIAGTNGKGSVAEYLTNILRESGVRTGTFTSPYIRRYRDRIRLNGEDIPESAVCSACELIRRYAAPDDGYSQFEIGFAMAMLYFTWVGAEIVVLETGMGGLLDCTNIIRDPLVCIITHIGLDHMAVLGNTIEEIARNKAGIIKPGAAVVLSPDNDDVIFRILRETAGEDCHPVIPALHTEGMCRLLEDDLSHLLFYYTGDIYRTGMGGKYQLCNALTAIETARQLAAEYPVTTETIQQGLAKTTLPGRMQILAEKPLTLLDGAHNRDGIDSLARTLREEYISPAIGIIGMTHADAAPYAAQVLGECFDRVLCVDSFTPNAMPARELDSLFDEVMGGARSQSVALGDAMKIAKNWARQNGGSIVICGSLFLASWFLNEG